MVEVPDREADEHREGPWQNVFHDFALLLVNSTMRDLSLDCWGQWQDTSSVEVLRKVGRSFFFSAVFHARHGRMDGTTTTRLCLTYPQKGRRDQEMNNTDRSLLSFVERRGPEDRTRPILAGDFKAREDRDDLTTFWPFLELPASSSTNKGARHVTATYGSSSNSFLFPFLEVSLDNTPISQWPPYSMVC